jgi:N-acetyl-anhydromuramyl-L-alanine amidase AmpD
MIDKWHRDKGWNGIGYHFVIVNDKHDEIEDGTVQKGRDIGIVGAHARGLNSRSIGICCVGHGDYEPFTKNQTKSLVEKISELIDQYDEIKVEDVIGHRELNKLVSEGILSSEYATSKTCPGMKVDMAVLRDEIRKHRAMSMDFQTIEELGQSEKNEVLTALATLERTSGKVFPNANAEFKEFLNHPEVTTFRGS